MSRNRVRISHHVVVQTPFGDYRVIPRDVYRSPQNTNVYITSHRHWNHAIAAVEALRLGIELSPGGMAPADLVGG